MMTLSFESAKLKINRAQEHILQLEPLLESWIETEPYKVVIDKDPETGQNRVSVDVTETIPSTVATVIGDAIHNLRTALDHAAYEIATAVGASNTQRRRVYFPFEGNRKDLQASSKYRAIESASKKAAGIILNTIKPYEAGNHALWSINKMDVMDKHRLLLPHAQAISVAVNAVDDSNNISNYNLIMVGAGTVSIECSERLYISGNSKPVFNIFFGPDTPLKGEPVPETLRMMVVEVERALSALRRI